VKRQKARELKPSKSLQSALFTTIMKRKSIKLVPGFNQKVINWGDVIPHLEQGAIQLTFLNSCMYIFIGIPFFPAAIEVV